MDGRKVIKESGIVEEGIKQRRTSAEKNRDNRRDENFRKARGEQILRFRAQIPGLPELTEEELNAKIDSYDDYSSNTPRNAKMEDQAARAKYSGTPPSQLDENKDFLQAAARMRLQALERVAKEKALSQAATFINGGKSERSYDSANASQSAISAVTNALEDLTPGMARKTKAQINQLLNTAIPKKRRSYAKAYGRPYYPRGRRYYPRRRYSVYRRYY